MSFSIFKRINRLSERYANLISKYPTKVVISYFVFSALLTAIGLYFGLEEISNNPHEGFETRGTEMANNRLMLTILGGKVMSPQQLLLYNQENIRLKRQITQSATEEPDQSVLNFTINYDDYGKEEFLSVEEITSGCSQYFALGKYYPYNVIDLLVKGIFRIESFNALCELDDIIDKTVHKTRVSAFRASLPYSFNLPHYGLCVNSTYTKKCDDLNQKDLDIFKEEILKCAANQIGGLCNTTIAHQLRFFIIEEKANPQISPLYIGAILRVQLYPGWSADSTRFYKTLFDDLNKFYSPTSIVELKGINMNFKEQLFLQFLIDDCYLAIIAVGLVVLVVIISHGLSFSISLIAGMLLSIGVAFFIYVVILQIKFFPFINLLAILISIAISFDNGFLLAFQFEKAHQNIKYSLNNEITETHQMNDRDNRRIAIKMALSHAGFSMFVADFTTIIAFVTNCTSNIIVLKCFGLFAALTIATNFIFAISGMPALIMLINSKCKSRRSFLPLKWTRCTKSIGASLHNFNIYKLPRMINCFKWPILVGCGMLFAFCLYSMTIYPGIRLPDNNPLQLLRSSHPFEWFDEHEMNLFDFSHYRVRQMNFYVVFGVSSALDSSSFEPKKLGQIRYDDSFKIENFQKLQQFEKYLQDIRNSSLVDKSQQNGSKLWITEFANYVSTSNGSCKTEFDFEVCVREFTKKAPTFGFPDDFSMSLKDGPLFDAANEKLIGYFMVIPSRHKLLFVYSKIKPFVEEMNQLRNDVCTKYVNTFSCPIFVPAEYLARMADLLSILLNSTLVSILICVSVCTFVILFTTRHLLLSACVIYTISLAICTTISFVLWLGWYINVVEATIVIITIGLSFDYTLHMAVSFKMAPLHLNYVERMTRASSDVHSPIFLAALTNSAGGIALIWSKTQPFYEIGVFLLTIAAISYLSAVLLFPTVVFCCYGIKNSVKRCD